MFLGGEGIIPGPGYPVALLVKYISSNKLFTPASNLIFLSLYDIDKSAISYEGIWPITPLRFPDKAFEESVNWLDRYEY